MCQVLASTCKLSTLKQGVGHLTWTHGTGEKEHRTKQSVGVTAVERQGVLGVQLDDSKPDIACNGSASAAQCVTGSPLRPAAQCYTPPPFQPTHLCALHP